MHPLTYLLASFNAAALTQEPATAINIVVVAFHLMVYGFFFDTSLVTVAEFRGLFPLTSVVGAIAGFTLVHTTGIPPTQSVLDNVHAASWDGIVRTASALLILWAETLPIELLPETWYGAGIAFAASIIAALMAYFILRHRPIMKLADNARKLFLRLVGFNAISIAVCMTVELFSGISSFWLPVSLGVLVWVISIIMYYTGVVVAPPQISLSKDK